MINRLSLAICLLAASVGCSTTQTSNTARTATEQLLISNAVDQALDKVDFSVFNGHAVFLQDKYVDCVDKSYIISSVRHRLLTSGALLVDAADKSEVTVELRSGAVGTNSADSFVGVPEVVLPGMLTIPEVRFLERKTQLGTAKIGIMAYDSQTGAALGVGGVSLAKSDDSNWFVAGVGPFQNGTVRSELKRGTSGNAGIVRSRLPSTVAFQAPEKDPGMQYAEKEIPTVDQVSHETTSDPEWTK